MKVISSTIQQYTLPLAKLLTTDTSQTTRQGLVLKLHSDTGLIGFGDISPLPGLHKESLSEATEQLLKYRSLLLQTPLADDILPLNGRLLRNLPTDLYPSVRSGIEMAIIDLLMQMNPIPNLPDSLPVNALLVPDEKPITEQVDELLAQGFSCVKMKVARQPLERDIEDAALVLAKIKWKATLRLDANRHWTLQEAKQFCDAVDMENIEYIEEPTQNPADHVQLNQSGNIPIALDETLTEIDCEQLDATCYRAVVLKPSVLGGFERTAQLVRWAQQHGITPVISSAFQTSLAIRMYLVFAVLNQITETPLGLDTAKWFKEDLLATPFVIENAKVALAPLTVRPKLREELLKPVETAC